MATGKTSALAIVKTEKEKALKAVARKGASKALTALDPDTQSVYNKCVALSKSSAVPMQYIGHPDQIFSTVVLGKEFGLGPMTSLLNIASINGKPSMSVHLMLGLCQKHKQFAWWRVVENTKEYCKVEMARKYPLADKPIVYIGEFSLAEARTAKLIKSEGAWEKWGKNMVKARAIAFACREAFADQLTGVYTLEEMDPERYIDESLSTDMRVVDEMEASELSGKPPVSEEEKERKTRQPIKTEAKEPKLAPGRSGANRH